MPFNIWSFCGFFGVTTVNKYLFVSEQNDANITGRKHLSSHHVFRMSEFCMADCFHSLLEHGDF